jgi:hypothetical protein
LNTILTDHKIHSVIWCYHISFLCRLLCLLYVSARDPQQFVLDGDEYSDINKSLALLWHLELHCVSGKDSPHGTRCRWFIVGCLPHLQLQFTLNNLWFGFSLASQSLRSTQRSTINTILPSVAFHIPVSCTTACDLIQTCCEILHVMTCIHGNIASYAKTIIKENCRIFNVLGWC